MVIDNISRLEQLGHRIDNANLMLIKFDHGTWGYNLWDKVLKKLTREWQREVYGFTMGTYNISRRYPARSSVFQRS